MTWVAVKKIVVAALQVVDELAAEEPIAAAAVECVNVDRLSRNHIDLQ
ncbi:hypothetical protein [Thalassoroseus pseudoceratinae]|nr:hypothetical protein [Thalassoroseus pseudoceratinae]